jgi:hypothetical protein
MQDQGVSCPRLGVVQPFGAAHAGTISVMGVEYAHYRTAEGGDLYLTRRGLLFRDQLEPGNWYARDWFNSHRVRLPGTSHVYRVRTRPVRGIHCDLVVRFSRVGQDVPSDTLTLQQNLQAEFNSPFEEFAIVTALRAARHGPEHTRIHTKPPLAIYSPPERMELWQTGRKESKMSAKQARHPEIELDSRRAYILLYGWIRGLSAVQVSELTPATQEWRDTFLSGVTVRAIQELRERGFRMLDIKPDHVVLRMRPDGRLARRRNGQLAYAIVDYELLERVERASTAGAVQ